MRDHLGLPIFLGIIETVEAKVSNQSEGIECLVLDLGMSTPKPPLNGRRIQRQ